MYGDSLLFKNFLFNKKLRNPFNTIQIMTAIIVPEIIPAKISPGSSSERKTALGIPFNKDNRDKTTKGVPHGTPIRKRTKRLSKTTKENI